MLDVLLGAGADIDAPGAVVGGGTPLSDATAFAQWRAAFRLVERGAGTTLFTAAVLGLQDRGEVDAAFWGACHGGRLPTARYLADRGADLDWVATWEPVTPLDAVLRTSPGAVDDWLRGRGARRATDLA